MRRRAAFISLVIFVSSCIAMAQQWEVRGASGFGVYHNASVTDATGSAVAGFATELAGGLVIGENLYRRLGGEFRYTYRDGDLKLQSAGQEASMEGRSHAVHYDFLYHA